MWFQKLPFLHKSHQHVVSPKLEQLLTRVSGSLHHSLFAGTYAVGDHSVECGKTLGFPDDSLQKAFSRASGKKGTQSGSLKSAWWNGSYEIRRFFCWFLLLILGWKVNGLKSKLFLHLLSKLWVLTVSHFKREGAILPWYFAERFAMDEITSGDCKGKLRGFECSHPRKTLYFFWFVTSWGGNPWEQNQTNWNYGEGRPFFIHECSNLASFVAEQQISCFACRMSQQLEGQAFFFSTAHNRCTCGKGLFHQSFFFRIGFRWIQLVTFVFYWTRFESAVLKVFSNKNTEHTVHDMLMSSLVIDTRYKFVQNIWRHSLFPSCFFALCRRIAVQYMSQKVIPKWRTHFGRKMYMAKQDMNIYIYVYIYI